MTSTFATTAYKDQPRTLRWMNATWLDSTTGKRTPLISADSVKFRIRKDGGSWSEVTATVVSGSNQWLADHTFTEAGRYTVQVKATVSAKDGYTDPLIVTVSEL